MLEFPENSGEEPLEGGCSFSTSLGESIWLGEGTYYDPDCKTLTEEQVAFLEGGRLTIRIDEGEAESRGLRPGITFCFENGNARPTADWSLFDPYDRRHPLAKINVEPLWEEGAGDDDDEQYLETEEPKAMLQSLAKNLLYAYAGHSGFLARVIVQWDLETEDLMKHWYFEAADGTSYEGVCGHGICL